MAAKRNTIIFTIFSSLFLALSSCQTNIDNGGFPEMNEQMKAYLESFIEQRVSKFTTKSTECNDIVVLKERMAQLEGEMEELKNKNNDLMKEVEMLRAERFSAEKRTETSSLVTEMGQAKGENILPNSKKTWMYGVNNITSAILRQWSGSSSGIKKVYKHSGPRIRRGTPIVTEDQSISFSAILSDTITHMRLGQTILFRRTITNLGLHYNDQTGVFTCPETGTYVFHTSIYVDVGQWVHFNIVQNGNIVSWGLTNSYAANIVGSKLVIVHLEKNDRVWVNVQFTSSTSAIITDSLSSFSGFKI